MKYITIVFIINFLFLSHCVKMQRIPDNPCPSILRYLFDGRHWLASITVLSPPESTGIATLSVNFSVEGILPNGTTLILNDYNKGNLLVLQKIKTGQPLTYTVEFARHTHIPSVTLIKLNDNILCIGPPVSALTTSWLLMYNYLTWGPQNVPSKEIYHSSSLPPRFRDTDNTIPYHTTPSYDIRTRAVPKPKKNINPKKCGIISKPFFVRIAYGEEPSLDSHPWLVALFDFSKMKMEFFCAGNLISTKHILTAVHCIREKNPNKIQIGLGIHNINDLEEPGIQFRSVLNVIMHPDYQNEADADIAFILLNTEVDFTSSVKPICLWNYDPDFQAIIGYSGLIVGWGRQEHGELSESILETNVTITSKEDCRKNDLLRNMITDNTFCAGKAGTGPCSGDSGGGLFLKIDRKWYLRGIISMSIADKFTNICDVHSYAVYVDVAQYMDWIITNIDYYS